jgi:SAM-dependent methyltransferase
VRFAPDLRRLVDWDYILQLVSLAPEKVACVDAISSVYSTQNENRISVNYWPPDLDQLLAARGSVAQSILPSDVHVCSCCGYTGRFFSGPNGRPNAGCPQCGSLERHRFLLLLSMALRSYWVPETRRQDSSCLIEIAPSHATQKLRSLFGHDITVDAFPDADKRSVSLIASLTDLPLPSASADMLVALHVLEHIPDDKKAMAEIARVLTTAGVSILQVPMSACEATDEEIIEDPEVRKIRYGQADHVRFYGKDFYARLKACGLYSLAISPKESMLPESIAKYALAPDEVLVFVVRNDTPDAKAALDRFGRSLKKGAMIKT